MRTLLFAAVMLVAAPAIAQSQAPSSQAPSSQAPSSQAATRAVLADTTRTPAGRTVIIDGATWRCEGASCYATGGNSQPAARACRRVVARFGAVTEFSWKGEALDTAAITACNA